MIRFLQTPGPVKKIVLGGLLTLICAAMAITLIPGGLGSDIGLGGPGQGVLASVGGEPVTTLEVQREARQMLRQQFPRGGEQANMLLPYFAERAAQNLISKQVLIAEAERNDAPFCKSDDLKVWVRDTMAALRKDEGG